MTEPRIVVVDKNFLERPELEQFLQANRGNRILLHDFSAIEALAGNPLKNTILAMRIACKHPDQGFRGYCGDLQKAQAGDSARTAAIDGHARAAAEHLDKVLANVPLMVEFVARLVKDTSQSVVLARRDETSWI